MDSFQRRQTHLREQEHQLDERERRIAQREPQPVEQEMRPLLQNPAQPAPVPPALDAVPAELVALRQQHNALKAHHANLQDQVVALRAELEAVIPAPSGHSVASGPASRSASPAHVALHIGGRASAAAPAPPRARSTSPIRSTSPRGSVRGLPRSPATLMPR